MDGFDKGTKAVETKHALQVIDLLKRWDKANYAERAEILNDPVCENLLTQYRYGTSDLIWRLNKAIAAYDYKPKEQSIFDFAAEPDFDYLPVYAPIHDIEFEDAMECLGLLSRYIDAKTPDEKDAILSKLGKYGSAYSAAIKNGQKTPQDLFFLILKAMGLNKYRPKNLRFVDFVFSDDLNHIGGKFNTFDLDLSRDMKNNAPDTQIRDRFDKATANRFVLAQQLVYDWAVRLQKHPDLIAAAQQSDDSNKVKAYMDLCTTLANDFCDDYYLPHEAIKIFITNDKNVPANNQSGDNNYSSVSIAHHSKTLDLPSTLKRVMSSEERAAFHAAPDLYPGAKKVSEITLNLALIEESKFNTNNSFNKIISVFAHEMSHALDYLISQYGALGPQVIKADTKTYTSKNKTEYKKSATERVAFEVEDLLLMYLNNKDMQ